MSAALKLDVALDGVADMAITSAPPSCCSRCAGQKWCVPMRLTTWCTCCAEGLAANNLKHAYANSKVSNLSLVCLVVAHNIFVIKCAKRCPVSAGGG